MIAVHELNIIHINHDGSKCAEKFTEQETVEKVEKEKEPEPEKEKIPFWKKITANRLSVAEYHNRNKRQGVNEYAKTSQEQFNDYAPITDGTPETYKKLHTGDFEYQMADNELFKKDYKNYLKYNA
jgi:hypothetical protein